MYGIINKTNEQNVKNTMIDRLLSHLAPHLCYVCQKIGSVLCDNCKNDIVDASFSGCLGCRMPLLPTQTCLSCDLPYSLAWCVGERTAVLREVIDDYKFNYVFEAHKVLADLLAAAMPRLPSDCVVVPVPTISRHIRQRGYDHLLLIARHLARQKDVTLETLLQRNANTIQTGRTRHQRIAQAEAAFQVRGICKDKTILLVDDVTTTGATLHAAATLLRNAGARQIWVAVLAQQPLD